MTSDNGLRLSADNYNRPRRESYNSIGHHTEPSYPSGRPYYGDGPPIASVRPFSGLFHSALPDAPPAGSMAEDSVRSSRASSRDRNTSSGYNVLYLAASLFEFNIDVVKIEAGYPYLTYTPGEIFDVIGEKGELWLAKNQDDLREQVGWIWSKHFARLAT